MAGVTYRKTPSLALLFVWCMRRILCAQGDIVVTGRGHKDANRFLNGEGEREMMMKKGGSGESKMMKGMAMMMRQPSPTKSPVMRTRKPSRSNAPTAEPPRRATYPYLTLITPNDRTFNPIVGDVCVELNNAKLDETSINFTINDMNVTHVVLGKTKVCVYSHTFGDGANSIQVLAKDVTGVFELSLLRQIQAGGLSLTTSILDDSGNAFTKNTTVTAKLSDNALVSSVANTVSGVATFTNLPRRTVTFEAVGPGNEVGTAGTNPSLTSAIAITVFDFENASAIENKDFSQGLSGWIKDKAISVSLKTHIENVGPPLPSNARQLQLDQDLVLSTGGSRIEQRVSHTFTSSEDACAVKVRYRFVTSEVPGGYFGSQFNDYFGVSIRAQNSKQSVVETGTMNGLGLAAFDFSTGSTNWRETVLLLKEDFLILNDKVQVDLTVANVADGEYNSFLEVDFVEEIFPGTDSSDDPCACAKCEKWYKQEIADTSWINDLPRCPCSVVPGKLKCTVRPAGSDVLTGSINGVNWDTDKALNPCTGPSDFHPGAVACLRADGPNGTVQQCCYGSNLRILEHGTPGAGTPDRGTSILDHVNKDVDTFKWCCEKCKKLCSYYIGSQAGGQGARSDPRHSSTGCTGA